MKFSRALGQVFLKDKEYAKKILSYLLDEDTEDTFLEIGPGHGELTEHLIHKVSFVYCVEFDGRLCVLLKNKFSHSKNINIIQADILKFPFWSLKKKLIICGNIPYHISTHLIQYLVSNRQYVKNAYLMFQKEFAQKLIAAASTPHYGFLSCYIQYYAKVEKLFDLPASAFIPQPKVDSSFCKLDFSCKPLHKIDDEKFLFKTIRRAFMHRRKKIANALFIPKDACDAIFSTKIQPSLRPENLSLDDYIWLANNLQKCKVDVK